MGIITEIRELSNEELVKKFETLIRNGAGHLYVGTIMVRKEIIKRMEYGELV